MKKFLSSRSPKPPCIPKEIGFRGLPDPPTLPPWLSEEDVNYYATKFNQKGFTGGLNYYRCMNLYVPKLISWHLEGQIPSLYLTFFDIGSIFHALYMKPVVFFGKLSLFVDGSYGKLKPCIHVCHS